MTAASMIIVFIYLDITFVNYGLDSIIVEDDGRGINSEDMNEIGIVFGLEVY
jgi:hypothetical protein